MACGRALAGLPATLNGEPPMLRFPKLALTWLTVLLLAGLVVTPSLQIVMRGLFGLPFIGSEELSRFLLICLIFTAYPLVVAEGENIVMGELKAALPALARRVLDLTISLAAVGSSAFLAWVTYQTIYGNLRNVTPTLKIPFWIFLSATLIGFAGAAIVHLVHLRRPPQKETNIAL
jgi:TRAP-type C4-dicarboxylate transport system permease small subunit